MINVQEYNLPDFNIYANSENAFSIWQPENTCVVIGASNKPVDSLKAENIIGDNIAVYKRPTGGQAVVLTPETVVISVLQLENSLKTPKVLFQKINSLIIQSLQQLGVKQLSHKGISDIAIADKKILGSALYRNKAKNFYHAVLNLSANVDIIERYLKHPVKEPDYRNGRSHSEFVTSLWEEGYNLNIEEIIDNLKTNFEKSLFDNRQKISGSI